MILIIAVLAILLLIACVAFWDLYGSYKFEKGQAEFWEDGWHELEERYKLSKKTGYSLEQEVQNLKRNLADIEASFKKMVAENEDELGFGHHVKWRSHRKPTSETYRIHFDMEPNGQRILEELTARFKRGVYTEDERETCRRIGRSEVVDFIINRINTANDSKYSEHLELAHMEQYND